MRRTNASSRGLQVPDARTLNFPSRGDVDAPGPHGPGCSPRYQTVFGIRHQVVDGVFPVSRLAVDAVRGLAGAEETRHRAAAGIRPRWRSSARPATPRGSGEPPRQHGIRKAMVQTSQPQPGHVSPVNFTPECFPSAMMRPKYCCIAPQLISARAATDPRARLSLDHSRRSEQCPCASSIPCACRCHISTPCDPRRTLAPPSAAGTCCDRPRPNGAGLARDSLLVE